MSDTHSAFVDESNPMPSIVAGVLAVAAVCAFFVLFAGSALLELGARLNSNSVMQAVLGALALGGIIGTLLASKNFSSDHGRSKLTRGFLGCLAAGLIGLIVRHEALVIPLAGFVGLSLGWTTVCLALCLRPTLHFNRLGAWCGLGVGLAYAICTQPLIFNAGAQDKTAIACVAAALGALVSLRMRSGSSRPSSLPDYQTRASVAWIVALMTLVFLDVLLFYIIQNSAALKRLSWDTPLILQGNAFIHLCAAFVTGLALDKRWLGMAALSSLLLLVISGFILGLELDRFPTARILYVTAVSIYVTLMVYLPARSGRPAFTAALYSLGGWLAAWLALVFATAMNARVAPAWLLVPALLIGVSALFSRFFWIKRQEEIDSDKVVFRRAV